MGFESMPKPKSIKEKQEEIFTDVRKRDERSVDEIHTEANWENTQGAIRDAVLGVMGHMDSQNEPTILKLFNTVEKAQSLESFNDILDNDSSILWKTMNAEEIKNALKQEKVQDILKTYYENRK
jgi:hypothetical protein